MQLLIQSTQLLKTPLRFQTNQIRAAQVVRFREKLRRDGFSCGGTVPFELNTVLILAKVHLFVRSPPMGFQKPKRWALVPCAAIFRQGP
eukprot:5924362-Amphidinium_carterae.1